MLREIYQAQEDGQKAFPYRVELTDAGGPLYAGSAPRAYNDYNGFNAGGRTSTPLSQREAPAHMQTYGGNQSIDWLMDAVSFTVTAAASANWHFEDNGKPLAIEKKPTDPSSISLAPESLVRLFKEPNPFMNWEELCEISLIDWLLVGNAYWVKWQTNADGQPLALYRMAPQFVKIVPGRFGPEKYRYRIPGAREDVEFTPDQIIHFKRVNPLDPYYGLGLVKAGARALDMEIELTKTMRSYYEKQAMPSGVVQSERRVPRDVFNKLKSQMRAFYSGGDAAGQLMVLEAGLKYNSVSPSAADALFATMGAWSRDRILAMFNLNKGLLGIWDGTGDPKLPDWQFLFDHKTMVPLCSKFSAAISRGLTKPGWALDFCIDYEEVQQPDAILSRADTLAKLPGVKVHEVRAAAKLPPSTGQGEEIDNTVLNMPGPNMDANGQGGTADPNLSGEKGRPPLPKNTSSFQKKPPAAVRGGNSAVRGKPGKKSIDEIEAELDLLLEIKALAPADHVHVGKLGAPVVPPQDVLHPKRTDALDGLAADIESQIARAVHTLERGLLDSTEGKAEGTVYQRVKNSAAWKTFKDTLEGILKSGAQGAVSMANTHHINQGLDATDLDYEALADETVHRPDGSIASIMKTLKDRVLKRVLTSQQKADPLTDVQAEVRDALAEWKTGTAPGVALDTGVHGYNRATVDIAESNGSTELLVSDGLDHDKPCIEANGETWPLAKARKNLQEHPRCRRAFVALPAVA